MKKPYIIDLKMLKKAKDRGFCLCDALKKDNKENECPCEEFLKSGICKCGVYKEIKKKEIEGRYKIIDLEKENIKIK